MSIKYLNELYECPELPDRLLLLRLQVARDLVGDLSEYLEFDRFLAGLLFLLFGLTELFLPRRPLNLGLMLLFGVLSPLPAREDLDFPIL